jgi:hypothetical protein
LDIIFKNDRLHHIPAGPGSIVPLDYSPIKAKKKDRSASMVVNNEGAMD